MSYRLSVGVKRFLFCYVFAFGSNAQAQLASCVDDAFLQSEAVVDNSTCRDNAYILQEAIINGDTDKLKEIADRNYTFSYVDSPKLKYKNIGIVNSLYRIIVYKKTADISFGGGVSQIRATAVKGTGKLFTNSSFEDIKKSIQISRNYIKTYSSELGIDPKFLDNHDITIWTKPRGRSLDLAIVVAMMSLITKRPINSNIAMTGHIRSDGKVFPVGGIGDKILAAFRHGHKVIIPEGNYEHLITLPEEFRDESNVVTVGSVKEALDIALENNNDQVEEFQTDDLLLLAAHVAANNMYEKKVIRSLRTLVDMGFGISIEDEIDRMNWVSFFWSQIGRSQSLNQEQKQMLEILMDAGLTVEQLHFDDGEFPIHQSLLIGDHDKFETIINSGLITEDNINLRFYPRDFDSKRRYFGKSYDNTKTTLLHWISSRKLDNYIISPLIAIGANTDVTIDIIDEEYGYSPMGITPLQTAHKANNYLAVIELIEAGANTDGFDINAQISIINDLTLFKQASIELEYPELLYRSSHKQPVITPSMKLKWIKFKLIVSSLLGS